MKIYWFKRFFISILLGLSLFSFNARAAERPEVQGRFYIDTCGYYSATVAELQFQYLGPLEPGARVYLKYGTIGYNQSYSANGNLIRIPFDWKSIHEVEMPHTHPGVHSLQLKVDLHERSSNFKVEKLGFVFHVILPHGEYWDNGHQSTWGSYEIDLKPEKLDCWNKHAATAPPTFKNIPIYIHNKN